MEDLNMVAADCVIISCCCQCLILQVLIYILLKLPYKLFRKAMQRIKKIGERKKIKLIAKGVYDDRESVDSLQGSFRMHVEGYFVDGCHHGDGCCMDEVEKVLEEFSLKGEFAFGSLWDGEGSRRFSSCLAEKELDYGVVNCYLTKTFGSFEFE